MRRPFAIWRQYLAPQHALTRFAGIMSHCEVPWIKNYLIHWFLKRYAVNLAEAIEPNPYAYPSYHEFFIRKLKPDCRPIDATLGGVTSPCDGTISQIGKIERGSLLQAKGHTFSVEALLGDASDASAFYNGNFATIYLAPKDYHRVHMPYSGTLEYLRYIPGKLFSVNPLTTDHVEQLFAQNERVITFFKHDEGSFAIILVGAMIVGSIFTRWGGHITPHRESKMRNIKYPQLPEQHIKLDKGEEMGYFSLGSTVILLFADNMKWEKSLTQGNQLIVGQRIGRFLL